VIPLAAVSVSILCVIYNSKSNETKKEGKNNREPKKSIGRGCVLTSREPEKHLEKKRKKKTKIQFQEQ
jgi:hypothetical protein